MMKSKWASNLFFQRAAGGVIAAEKDGPEWTSEGKRKRILPKYVRRSRITPSTKSAYVSTCEWTHFQRQAGWHHRNFSCPGIIYCRDRIFVFPANGGKKDVLYDKALAQKRRIKNL